VALQATAPCASKVPNRWGLFDVVGNVWEATGDRLASLPVGENRYLSDLTLCGGGYDSGSNDCRAVYRAEGKWELQLKVGFRVVCVSAERSGEPVTSPEDGRAVLDFLTGAAGDEADLLPLRAELHGRFSDWQAAAADYGRIVKTSRPHYDLLTEYAPLLLQTGDKGAYRSLCRRLLNEYGTTTNPVIAERVAKACLLAEGDALDNVLKLLKTALDGGPPAWAKPYAELARGMAEYRRGEPGAALVWLRKCREHDKDPISEPGQALCGFFQAMAHHRLGQRDEAARVFAEAQALQGRLVDTQATRGDAWKDILRAKIAEAEAKGLLKDHPR
jgi:tetratricopeptide (TPR) repeat protein